MNMQSRENFHDAVGSQPRPYTRARFFSAEQSLKKFIDILIRDHKTPCQIQPRSDGTKSYTFTSHHDEKISKPGHCLRITIDNEGGLILETNTSKDGRTKMKISPDSLSEEINHFSSTLVDHLQNLYPRLKTTIACHFNQSNFENHYRDIGPVPSPS